MQIHARKVLSFPTNQLWSMITGEFEIVFDNGEVVKTHERDLIYSSYFWDFHRRLYATPLLPEHLVSRVLNGKPLGAKSHLQLIKRIYKDAYNAHSSREGLASLGMTEPALRDLLARIMYEVNNLAYNGLSTRTVEYVTSMDILDFVEIVSDEEIVKAETELVPTYKGVEDTYKVADRVLRSPKYKNNMLAKAYCAGAVKDGQVHQMVTPRGGVTDLDGENPIIVKSSFVNGIWNLAESLVETRSAGKHLASAKGAISTTEYFSRRMQFVAQKVKNLHYGDCGSQSYLHTQIKESELPLFVGMNYFDETTGSIKPITKDDKHLCNRPIKLRSVLHCAHEDPYGVCSKCMGEIAYALPERSNIGHFCEIFLGERFNQTVLSTKHLLGNVKIQPITLDEIISKFFVLDKDGATLYLNKRFKDKKLKIHIPVECCAALSDIFEVSDVSDLSIARVTEFSEMGVEVTEGDETRIYSVNTVWDKRSSSLSYDMLEYVRKNGFTVEDSLVCIDLSDWNYENPTMAVPLRNYTMADYVKDFEKLLESTGNETRKKERKLSPDAFFMDVFQFLNSRLSVPAAIIQVVVYGYLVESMAEGKYNLPKDGSRREVAPLSEIMSNGSISVAFAHMNHYKIISSPSSYGKNRPDHPFDIFFCPREVTKVKT